MLEEQSQLTRSSRILEIGQRPAKTPADPFSLLDSFFRLEPNAKNTMGFSFVKVSLASGSIRGLERIGYEYEAQSHMVACLPATSSFAYLVVVV